MKHFKTLRSRIQQIRCINTSFTLVSILPSSIRSDDSRHKMKCISECLCKMCVIWRMEAEGGNG